jgi:hypothetical protein
MLIYATFESRMEMQNGNEVNYLAEGKSKKVEEKQQLLIL